MPTWLVIAALATIGITALLIGVLTRVNKGPLERAAARANAIEVSQNSGRQPSDDSKAREEG